MWEDIEIPWQKAFEQGWEALRNGSIPIGSVIEDECGNIISSGRNRIYENAMKNSKIAHAETDALLNLEISKFPNVREYTLFACMEPCPMCMGTIVMSNIRKLRVAARDSYCGAVHYCEDDPYIANKKLQVSFELGELELVQLTLQIYFELKTRDGVSNRIVEIFENDCPLAATLAKSFLQDGYLERCMTNDVAFGEVFNQIVMQSN